MSLRYYQNKLYLQAREAIKKHRAICIQAPTGAGKTVLFSAMCESVFKKNKLAWIVVTRKELQNQASKHLLKWNIPHGQIKPGHQESKAFDIHIASSDTLIRRLKKIKRFPDLIIFDECHVMLDRQIEIVKHLPVTTKIIGFTATPERTDGRGLSELYETLIEGPSIPWLTERGFLCDLKYFSPPIDGLNEIKRRGTEYDEIQLDELLKRKKIYGKVIDHYKKYGIGRQALIFCRSVKSAEHMAEQFKEQGFKFYNIDGSMNDNYRFGLVEKLNNGEIDGLCGCDVFIYGVDVPRVSYGAMIRPTLSKTVYYQSIGRILRPFPGKQDALFFDHVNNLLEHQEPGFAGIPPHYLEKINWNFTGTVKRKKEKIIGNPKLCPHLDFMYCNKPSCLNCEHNPDKTIKDVRKPMVVIPTELKKIEKPSGFKDMPFTERREYQDKIGSIAMEYKSGSNEAVKKMLDMADSLGYSVYWAYHKLNGQGGYAVNVPLLAEIQRIKGYSYKWIYIAKNKVRKR